MRYYVVKCGYSHEFRFEHASDAGYFIANLASHVQLDEAELRRSGSDYTSFDFYVYEEMEGADPEQETEEADPEIVRPGELDLPFEEVGCDD